MIRLFFILSAVLLSNITFAQTGSSLPDVNRRLNFIYAQVFENVDTQYINFRRECNELIRQNDKEMQLNGYRTLALLDMYQRRYTSSVTAFKKAIALDSACFICYRKLHWTYWYGKNDYGSATALWRIATRQFEKRLREDSSGADNWQRLYIMYSLNEGTLPRTVKDRMTYIAGKIVQLDSSRAYYWWQYSFHQDNDKNAKLYSLSKAVELAPANSVYWSALAGFYCEQKDITGMKQVLEDAKPATGDLSYWYQQKASYYYSAGLKKEALEVYKEAKSKGITIVYK